VPVAPYDHPTRSDRPLIATLLALSLVGSVAAWPVGRHLGHRSAGWLLAILPAGLFAGFLRFTPAIEAGRIVTERFAWAPSLGVNLALRLDGFALLFCLLISGIGALVVIYAGAYFTEYPASERARFHALILFFMTAMLGAVLADDLITLFVFWESTSVISFLLIGFDGASPSARRSALMSLRVTAGGGLALLAAILGIGVTLGSYSMTDAITPSRMTTVPFWISPAGPAVRIRALALTLFNTVPLMPMNALARA